MGGQRRRAVRDGGDSGDSGECGGGTHVSLQRSLAQFCWFPLFLSDTMKYSLSDGVMFQASFLDFQR